MACTIVFILVLPCNAYIGIKSTYAPKKKIPFEERNTPSPNWTDINLRLLRLRRMEATARYDVVPFAISKPYNISVRHEKR